MNTIIESYINPTMQVLQAYLDERDNEGQRKRNSIPKEMKGYISSLGAAILMSGLVPSIAFYAAKESKADRGQVLQWVYGVLNMNNATAYPSQADAKAIFNQVRADASKYKKIERDILNVSIALKLCIRTFELT